MPTRAVLWLPVGLLGLILFTGSARAQSASAADLDGTVEDGTGAALPGATLVITNVETGVERTVASGPDGRCRASALPVGLYSLDVTFRLEAPGLGLAASARP